MDVAVSINITFYGADQHNVAKLVHRFALVLLFVRGLGDGSRSTFIPAIDNRHTR